MNSTAISESCLTSALGYASRSFRVIPVCSVIEGVCDCGKPTCTSAGKHPHVRSWQKAASNDQGQIRRWWKLWPIANIGIVTGAASGVFVVDVDGEQGNETLCQLMHAHNWKPETLTARTGKGLHLYFAHPGGKVLNSVRTALGDGIDVRGDGGYVVAPPSRHRSGVLYQWESENVAISQAPQWLIDLATSKNHEAKEPIDMEDVQATAAQEVDEIILEGERNNALTSTAGKLRAGGMGRAEIETHLLSINAVNCKPPLPEDEVRTIASSVCRYDAGVLTLRSMSKMAEENPLYYFPFNLQEWCADTRIFMMADHQVGWYIWLVVECWKNQGMLPNDPAMLFKLARASSRDVFDREKDAVLAAFDELVDGERPILIHRRMAELWQEQSKKYTQRVEAGKRSGESRARQKAEAKGKAEPIQAEPAIQ